MTQAWKHITLNIIIIQEFRANPSWFPRVIQQFVYLRNSYEICLPFGSFHIVCSKWPSFAYPGHLNVFPMDDDGASLFRINGVATTSNWWGWPASSSLKNSFWSWQIALPAVTIECYQIECYLRYYQTLFYQIKKKIFYIVPPRQWNYTDGIFLADVSVLRHDERLTLSAKISKIILYEF